MYRFAATLGAGALLIFSVGEPAAQAPKPNIQPPSIRPPVITPNIPVQRLADDGQENGDSGPGETPEKASVATEPTRPGSPAARRAAAPVRPWLPATSPLPQPRLDEHAPGLVPLPGADRARNHELEDESRTADQPDDGHIGRDDTLAGARGPELDVPDGLREMFEITGGNINDLARLKELEELAAATEFWRDAAGGPFEDPANLLRRTRFGDGMEGPPVGDTHGLGDGRAASDWRLSRDGDLDTWRGGSVEKGSTTYERRVWYEHDGGAVIRETTTSWGPVESDGSRSGRDTSDLLYVINGEKRTYTVWKRVDGRWVQIDDGELEEGQAYPSTSFDQNGDGTPDDAENTEAAESDEEEPETAESEGEEPENDDAGGGSQTGDWDAASGGTGGCGVWTPFGGCTGTGPKVWETTGQPDPMDDGSSTVSSAGASIGPEAVTNSGDGSFGAGDNIGGSGGFGHDPCATVRGCGGPSGGGGPGPEGPPQP